MLRRVAYSLDGICHRCGRAQELAGRPTAPTREEYRSHLDFHRDVSIVGCAYCLVRQDDRRIELRTHAAVGTAPQHDSLFDGDVAPLDAGAPTVPELAQADQVLDAGAAEAEQVLDAGAAVVPERAQAEQVLDAGAAAAPEPAQSRQA